VATGTLKALVDDLRAWRATMVTLREDRGIDTDELIIHIDAAIAVIERQARS
jgi:hypothetical protein